MIDEVNMHKDDHRRNQTECMTQGEKRPVDRLPADSSVRRSW